jgi:WD40 repeat protein
MGSQESEEGGRRLFLAAGASKFANARDLDGVPQEIIHVSKTLMGLHYERELEATSLNGSFEAFKQLFKEFRSRCKEKDLAVVYFTSHGQHDPKELRRFYVWASNTNEELHESGVAADDIARFLLIGSKAAQLLLIMDVCFAGGGTREFLDVAARFTDAISGEGPEIWVVASARATQIAQQGWFAVAFENAIRNGFGDVSGKSRPYLSPESIVQSVNAYFTDRKQPQRATLSSTRVEGECRLFGNPRYERGIPANVTLDQQTAIVSKKAKGIHLTDPLLSDWYFTGRAVALGELLVWLSGKRSDGRARVITGSPGCGKTALIRQLHKLQIGIGKNQADSESGVDSSRAGAGGQRTANVYIEAHGKLVTEIVVEIAEAIGSDAKSADQLQAALGRMPQRFVMAIDGLDEAEQPTKVISELLLPIREMPNVFLVIATRPDVTGKGKRVKSMAEGSVEIDLDDARYLGDEDIANYVANRLRATEEPNKSTPYKDHPTVAKQIAEAIATRAHGNFLVADTAVQALLASDAAVDTAQEGWVSGLPIGLDQSFARFVLAAEARVGDSVKSQVLLAVLRALAFAEGSGLPWNGIWPRVASALSEVEINDADIASVQRCAAAFIVEGSEREGTVYRVYHDLLAETLRKELDQSFAQRRVVWGLLDLTGGTGDGVRFDWRLAHPYLLRHLPAHAAKATYLDQMLLNGELLLAADPERMLVALSRSREPLASKTFPIFSIAFDRLRVESPRGRRAYLEMVARQQGSEPVVSLLSNMRSDEWHVPWAHWQPVSTHRAIHLAEQVTSLAASTLHGKAVIVSGGSGKTVRVWDLATGSQLGDELAGSRFPVRTVGVVFSENNPFVVAAGDDQAIHAWEIGGRELFSSPVGHKSGVMALVVDSSNGSAVSGGRDGRLISWNLTSGERIGNPWLGRDAGVEALVLGQYLGRRVAFFGTAVGFIGAWDTENRVEVPIPRIARKGAIAALVYLSLGNTNVLAAGYRDGCIRLWNIVDGTCRLTIDAHAEGVRALSHTTVDGMVLIVSGGADRSIRLWNALTGQQVGKSLDGHLGPVNALVVTMLDDRPVVVSGSDDKTVRIWELVADLNPRFPSYLAQNKFTGFSASTDGAAGFGVSGGPGDVTRIWELNSGDQIAYFGSPTQDRSLLVAIAGASISRLIVAAALDTAVKIWLVERAGSRPLRTHHHQERITAVALSSADERDALLATAVEGGRLRLMSPRVDLVQCEPLRRDSATVHVLAFGRLAGRNILVSGDQEGIIEGWDTERGDEIFKIHGHTMAVRAALMFKWRERSALLSGGDDKRTILWLEQETSFQSSEIFVAPSAVTAVGFLLIGERGVIVSGCRDGRVRLNVEGGQLLGEIQVGSEVIGLVALSGGAIVIATVSGLMLVDAKDYLFRQVAAAQ